MVGFVVDDEPEAGVAVAAVPSSTEAETQQDEQAAVNESILIGDDRLVKVMIKIRTHIAEVTKAYEAEKKALQAQFDQVQNEVLKRLHERGATQTKTPYGTAFIGEKMNVTIADETVFHAFVLEQQDLDFLQKRVKVEHLKEYMDNHDGSIPPGLNLFREITLNVRAAAK